MLIDNSSHFHSPSIPSTISISCFIPPFPIQPIFHLFVFPFSLSTVTFLPSPPLVHIWFCYPSAAASIISPHHFHHHCCHHYCHHYQHPFVIPQQMIQTNSVITMHGNKFMQKKDLQQKFLLMLLYGPHYKKTSLILQTQNLPLFSSFQLVNQCCTSCTKYKKNMQTG